MCGYAIERHVSHCHPIIRFGSRSLTVASAFEAVHEEKIALQVELGKQQRNGLSAMELIFKIADELLRINI